MSAANTYDQATEWISRQTADVSSCRYGRNAASVQRGLQEQNQKLETVNKYEPTIQKAVSQTEDEDKKKTLQDSYAKLKEICEKKVHCLEMMLQVASLEENCSHLSRGMDERAVILVKSGGGQQKTTAGPSNLQGFIATLAQDCVFGVRDNWDWIARLVKCVDIHLTNASSYHQYFHEVEETEPWLMDDMARIAHCLDAHALNNNDEDTKKLVTELEGVCVALQQWEVRINRLWATAVQLVPVPLRTQGVMGPTPARTIADYETNEISVRAGEDVLLLSNSNPQLWKVRNGKGQEAEVPALIVLIPGPDKAAVEAAVRLRLELLATWTEAIKRIGGRVITYMNGSLKPHYSTKEIAALTSVQEIDKQTLLQLLSYIEDTLKSHWAEYDGFIDLQERILALRMILEELGETDATDEDLFKSLLHQITALAKIIELYQGMFKDWERFKVAVEASRAPELMLIVDKWEQLQFVSREYFAKFWKTKLPLDETDAASTAGLRNFTLDGMEMVDTVPIGGGPDVQSASVSVTGDGGLGRAETAQSTVTLHAAARGSGSDDSAFADSDKAGRGPGEHGSSGEGFDETRTRTRTTTTTVTTGGGSAGAGGSDGSDGTGFDETRTTVTTGGGSAGAGSAGSGRREVKMAAVQVLGGKLSSGSVGDDGSNEEGFEEIRETTTRKTLGSDYEGTDFGIATVRKTAETEQLMAAEVEENKTFIIRSVINPTDQSEISLQQAILLGIIRPNEGAYVNSVTGETKPIASAMSEGLIKVSFSTTKRGQEKTSSIGIITVKTIREPPRAYTIVTLRDTQTGTDVTPAEAVKLGFLDDKHGSYTDRKTNKRYLVSEAAEAGLVKIEYTDAKAPEPEVISKIYAVRAVVDRRQKKTITFHEAVRRGIINRDTGAYKDTLSGDTMYVGDAIMRGFLKARVIDDATGLDIDPENRMVIDKTEKIRKRLLKPLGVISAFKMAAAAASPPSTSDAKK